ncbi:S53 family peptidase [Prosthecobacter vanneervenii]|uniref:Subtilase family serine protease n=1 Tax=Prosthecobacter vanneervenii TaxID=48466 RepID=A0A7W7YGS9_9BACT|nr:S53 family peptidase [Prosthecobacter vanneervenii]MBB5035727.1 subtilase family serine protease [Prosthecobacter vanneervenii]
MSPTNHLRSFLIASTLAAFSAGLSAADKHGNYHRVDQNEGPPENVDSHAPETDRIHAHSPLWARGPSSATPQLTSGPTGYTPAQIRHAYGFDKITGNGAGQTIAIIDAYGSPSLANDLKVFCTTFGLPQATLGVYYPQGKPSANSGWALETSLDVQWAHAVAPGARIVVVVAKSASLSNLLGAVDYAVKTLGARQVSMSWGSSEFSSEASYDSHFNKAGVSFFASSGDSGAGVIWPAASPYVVAVGGTTLQIGSTGAVTSETGWSGSGGGLSAYYAKPSWQSTFTSATRRAVPDVSYDADPATGFPVYISNYNGTTGWIQVGGTSAGAPQWAAQQALINAARTTSMSSTGSYIYSDATRAYATDFYDITSGSNGAYTATPGLDLVTGLGSPNAAAFVPDMAAAK